MLLPKELKELFKSLPKISREIIDISAFSKAGMRTLLQSRDRSFYNSTVQNIDGRISKNNSLEISVRAEALEPNKLSQQGAEMVLRLYFEQLSWLDAPVHFDLRGNYFFEDEQKHLFWRPSSLSYSFAKDFLAGVKELYQGFYLENDAQFRAGLIKTKIISDADSATIKQEAFDLFQSHFATARSAPMRFELPVFRHSFSEIFMFFINNKKRLQIDFAYLGVCLTSLYLHLGHLNYELDVKQAFLDSSLAKV